MVGYPGLPVVYVASRPPVVRCFLHHRGETETYISQNALPHMVPGLSWPKRMLMGGLESGEDSQVDTQTQV